MNPIKEAISKERSMGIYAIENDVNGKLYIGSSDDLPKMRLEYLRRANKGSIRIKKVRDALLKYGKENFHFEVLEFVVDKSIIIERERFWIKHLNTMDAARGYNSCPPVKPEFNDKLEGEREGRDRVRLKAKDIPIICSRLNNGETIAEIWKSSSCSDYDIANIKKGRRWRDLAEVYLSEDILATWNPPPFPRGIHPDLLPFEQLRSICEDINNEMTDEKIGEKYGVSPAGISCIRKGGCRSSETLNLLSDDCLKLWTYNIHLIQHLLVEKNVKKKPKQKMKVRGNKMKRRG